MSEEPKANVFAIRSGMPITQPYKPVPYVVERLEWLLERAKAGEIQGFAGAWFWSDESVGCGWAGIVNYGLVGKLVQAQNEVLDALKE